MTNVDEIGTIFGHFLFPPAHWVNRDLSFNFWLERHFVCQHLPGYFGLYKKHCTAARSVVIDRRQLTLTLLQIACDGEHKKMELKGFIAAIMMFMIIKLSQWAGLIGKLWHWVRLHWKVLYSRWMIQCRILIQTKSFVQEFWSSVPWKREH